MEYWGAPTGKDYILTLITCLHGGLELAVSQTAPVLHGQPSLNYSMSKLHVLQFPICPRTSVRYKMPTQLDL